MLSRRGCSGTANLQPSAVTRAVVTATPRLRAYSAGGRAVLRIPRFERESYEQESS